MTTKEENFNLRALSLRFYWDGEANPSVLSPLGDFFGLGHGRGAFLSSQPLSCSNLGMNCWFPMPFDNGARITITNDGQNEAVIFFYIDYEEEGEHSAEGRFHCVWRRELVVEKPAPIGENANGLRQRLNMDGANNYVVLSTEGKGHYVGCVLHIDTNTSGWWGEGDDMFFIDGVKWPPDLHGTGMEDYFGGAWNYNNLTQTFSHPYNGYHFKTNPDYTGKHSQYRFHVLDPVHFEKSLLFSIEHGHANDRQGDWSSTAYWYQTGRIKPLDDIGAFEDRVPYEFGGIEQGGGKSRVLLP